MKIFLRTQISSLLATLVDFVITIMLVEFDNSQYLIATSFGAVGGAITNFIINKYWSFKMGSRKDLKNQSARYLLVWVGSIFLNIFGSNLTMKVFNIPYLISKIIISLIVGIGFNYTLQKKYVFATSKNTHIL
jgi:putative flippase GtrA